MENIVDKLFEAGLLSEDDKLSLQETFDAKINEAVEEAKSAAESQIREEMTQRFEHDKGTLVEAMDRMLTDVVQKHEAERVAEQQALAESKAKFDKARAEVKEAYKSRVRDHARVLESFVLGKLNEEISEFTQDKNAVSEMRVKYAKAIAECKQEYKQKMTENMSLMRKFVVEKLEGEISSLRKQQKDLSESRIALVNTAKASHKKLQEQYNARLATIDKFVVEKVTKELRDFQQDRNALVEKKVQLVSEARAKLAETQQKFVRQAAKLVDRTITETMKVELAALHEDLETNRQNMFGRRIFEAVQAEWQASYYSEGTELSKLQKVLESKDQELAQAKQKLTEGQRNLEQANRKAKFAEDKSSRTKVMSELLSPLNRDKRSVMEELLETVKTPQLREAFNKYLPAVLNESKGKVAPQSRQTLSEASKESTITVTGDRRNNHRLQESVQVSEENGISQETATILKLAGIK